MEANTHVCHSLHNAESASKNMLVSYYLHNNNSSKARAPLGTRRELCAYVAKYIYLFAHRSIKTNKEEFSVSLASRHATTAMLCAANFV